MFPGAAAPKTEYTAFASGLAEAGYTVMVLQSLVTVNPFPPLFPEPDDLNFPEATSTEVALNWFNLEAPSVFQGMDGAERGFQGGYGGGDAACPLPDTSTVLLAGHSQGAAVVRCSI